MRENLCSVSNENFLIEKYEVYKHISTCFSYAGGSNVKYIFLRVSSFIISLIFMRERIFSKYLRKILFQVQ